MLRLGESRLPLYGFNIRFLSRCVCVSVCHCVCVSVYVWLCVCMRFSMFVSAFVMRSYVCSCASRSYDCQLFVMYVVLVRFVPGGRFIRSQGPVFSFILCLRLRLCPPEHARAQTSWCAFFFLLRNSTLLGGRFIVFFVSFGLLSGCVCTPCPVSFCCRVGTTGNDIGRKYYGRCSHDLYVAGPCLRNYIGRKYFGGRPHDLSVAGPCLRL